MRTLKEVLRLHSLGLSQRQVARSCGISQSTVHEYLSAAETAGLRWPLPADWDDTRTERALFPQRGEAAVLRLGHAYEQSTGWHQEKPPISA